jgi:hypothetical protein
MYTGISGRSHLILSRKGRMMKELRKYSDELKAEAVKMANE